MKVNIRIDRAAAIRAGRDTFGDTIVAINPSDLTPDERETLIASPPNLADAGGNVWPGKYPEPPALADTDDVLAAVRAWLAWRAACGVERSRVAAEARAKAEQERQESMRSAEAYIGYWLGQPAERFTGWACGDGLPRGTADEPAPPPGLDVSAAGRLVREGLAGKLAEARELIAARKAASDARRTAQLADFVLVRGSPNQQARSKLGLLPEQEVMDAIRTAAYASLDGIPRYRKIRLDDIDHTDACYGEGTLDCETTEAEALSAAEYDVYSEIQRAAPAGAALEALVHSCTCSSCDAGLIRRSVRVAVKVGELSFSREYALGD